MEVLGIVLDEWQVWVLIGVLAFILEIFTPAFVAACLGIGMVLGGVASAAGLSYSWQLGFFSAGTALSFFLVRPFILKIGYKGAEGVKTNADSLIGKRARVTEAIDSSKNQGYVAVDGDTWRATSENGEPIEVGSEVEVVSRDSIVVTVRLRNS